VPALVLALALLVTAMLLFSVTRSIHDQDRIAFEAEVARTTDAARVRLDTTLTLLQSASGLFAASDVVRRDEFSAFVHQLRLRERYPGIQGIGYTERIPPARLAEVEQRERASGLPGFRVWPETPREEYHSILYLEPMDQRNAAAIGFDMYSEPTRREAMARARDTGAPAASGKVTLLQEIEEDKQPGFLIYVPVYRRGGPPPASLEARRSELEGFVYAPLRVGDLLRGVLGEARLVSYELFDGTEAAPAALMRVAGDEEDGDDPGFTADRMLQVGGRTWLLRFGSSAAFEGLSQRRLVPWLAVASLTASVLLAWIAWVQARARRFAEGAAAQRRRSEEALRVSEEQARERAQRLEQLARQLRESDRRKDEFLAVLAHELRNPLAPIRTSLEILQKVPEGAAARRARDVALRQVRQMVRLIDDLLDVSRISRGKINLQRAPVAVAALVDAALETSRPLVENRQHELRVEPIAADLLVDADAARIAQILTNLLNNAATYTPPGGRISVAAAAAGSEVRIAVRDTGVGLDAEQLQVVFEMFGQVRPSPAGGGLGIGLALAARLAEMHGGRIEVRSEGAGRGSEFVLVLPRSAAVAGPSPDGP